MLKLFQESSEIQPVIAAKEIANTNEEHKYLRTGETAKKIVITSETVQNMLEDGRFLGEKVGKH